jgi:histone deacetylase 6
LAVVKVILGEAPDELRPMIAGESSTETVWQVALEQSKYWKSVDPKACEPQEGGYLSLIYTSSIDPIQNLSQ